MIHGRPTCQHLESVVVAVEGMDTPEGLAFVSALERVLSSFCTVRTQTDRDELHAPGECPEVVLVTSQGDTRNCLLRILAGPKNGRVGVPAEITVLDPLHPEAPVHAAEALAQLPALAAVRGLRTLPATPALHCVPLAAYPDPEAAFHELYGLSSHRVWLDSSNAAMDPVAGRNRYSIMADDSGSRGMRAQHLNGVTIMESKLVIARFRGPFFSWLDRNWDSSQAPVPALPPGLGFALGWLGYLGYELKRECGGNAVESPLPDASLIRCSRAVVFDHEARCLYLLAGSRRRRPAMVQERRPTHPAPAFCAPAPQQPVASRTVQRSGLRPVLPSKNRRIPERNHAGKLLRGVPHDPNLHQPPREHGSVGRYTADSAGPARRRSQASSSLVQ